MSQLRRICKGRPMFRGRFQAGHPRGLSNEYQRGRPCKTLIEVSVNGLTSYRIYGKSLVGQESGEEGLHFKLLKLLLFKLCGMDSADRFWHNSSRPYSREERVLWPRCASTTRRSLYPMFSKS